MFVLLRAFSSGAVALSGVEAISDGVPAFQKPESRNAARTLDRHGRHPRLALLRTVAAGPPPPADRRTPSSRRCCRPSAPRSGAKARFLYYVLQFSTFAILILAANTAYADFPRLCSFIARDGFLPRQLANRGDRLVFSNGVLVLSGMAAVLVIIFGGETKALIPLYAVGVFTGFTLSQTRHGRVPVAPARRRAGRWP